jgi:3-phenylpropionate/cinnamic acid dioxygenase small subunit
MLKTVSEFRDEFADREAIRDCLYRYARGIDRIDEDMLRSVYWEDATDEHAGMFSGGASEFVDWLLVQLPLMKTLHVVANILIEIDGPRANVESYVYAIHRSKADGTVQDMIGAGRYLDHLERRNDIWRISERKVVVDWFRDYPAIADSEAGPFGIVDAPRGARKPHDASYAWFGAPADAA